VNAITQALARWGAMKSGDLYERVKGDFGSQRSFERALADTPGLLRLGSKRSRTYALRRDSVHPAPIYRRHESGQDELLGELLALHADQWAFAPGEHAPAWLQTGWLNQGQLPVYQGLPWFMDAFRPAGFLGRAWVRQHADAHGWPLDVRAWTEDQILIAAMQEPWDWRGDLSVGPFVDLSDQVVALADRNAEYAIRADLAMEGAVVGASAEGEQPKFTAVVAGAGGMRPVIVKFSGRLDGDAAVRRWADIMVTEAIANQVMTLHGIEAASTEVWMHDDRLWLETTRFDRLGARGRCGLVALEPLARTFNYQGPQNGWVRAVAHLERLGVVDAGQLQRTEHLATIGHLLLNNDMHMRNLSFLVEDQGPHPFTLSPVYDMTPMRWAPSATTGNVPVLQEEPVIATDDVQAMLIVAEIWEDTARHDLVSDEWRSWAASRAGQIRRML
jgi:hypothetical protein